MKNPPSIQLLLGGALSAARAAFGHRSEKRRPRITRTLTLEELGPLTEPGDFVREESTMESTARAIAVESTRSFPLLALIPSSACALKLSVFAGNGAGG